MIKQALPFVVVAGRGETDAVSEAWGLISSVLLLSSAAVSLTFVTDTIGKDVLLSRFAELSNRGARIPVAVQIYEHDLRRTRALAQQLNLTITHHSGTWGMTKLFLPWLFPHWHDIIVIDTDMVFVTDPAPLAASLERMAPHAVYSMPLTTKWPNSTKPSDICSCIVLLRCEAARDSGLHPTLWRSALKWWHKTSKTNHALPPPHGDQGMYYALWAMRPDLFVSLDESWNVDRCHRYYGHLQQPPRGEPMTVQLGLKAKQNENQNQATLVQQQQQQQRRRLAMEDNRHDAHLPIRLLHRNCFGSGFSTAGDDAQPFFEFFAAYRWHWHGGSHPISVSVLYS